MSKSFFLSHCKFTSKFTFPFCLQSVTGRVDWKPAYATVTVWWPHTKCAVTFVQSVQTALCRSDVMGTISKATVWTSSDLLFFLLNLLTGLKVLSDQSAVLCSILKQKTWPTSDLSLLWFQVYWNQEICPVLASLTQCVSSVLSLQQYACVQTDRQTDVAEI